jgi:hypothetical protein
VAVGRTSKPWEIVSEASHDGYSQGKGNQHTTKPSTTDWSLPIVARAGAWQQRLRVVVT